MTCPDCERCRREGARFCATCGAPLYDDGCPMCEASRISGDRYCAGCGRKLAKDENPLMVIGFWVGFVTMIILGCVILFEYAVSVWGIPTVFPHLSDTKTSIIMVVPEVVTLFCISGPVLQGYYILLMAALTACIFWIFYKAYEPVKKLVRDNDMKSVRDTALFEVTVLFASLFFLELLFSMVLSAFGESVGTLPDRETWKWMFELMEAPVWEEVVTRILYLGVPMMIVTAVRRNKEKPLWRYIFGGFRIDRYALFFIFFSAAMFGGGHLTNWNIWKFFPTFAFGLITGYLFCKYGVYATIVMHFLTNYLNAETWLFGTSSPMVTMFIVLLVMIPCIPYAFLYIKRGTDGMIAVIKGKDQNRDLR